MKKNQITMIIEQCVNIFGSVSSLSRYLDISRGTVSRWRNGHNCPSSDYILKLQGVLKNKGGKNGEKNK